MGSLVLKYRLNILLNLCFKLCLYFQIKQNVIENEIIYVEKSQRSQQGQKRDLFGEKKTKNILKNEKNFA